MYYGIVRKRRRFGSFLVFPLKSVGPIFQKLWIFLWHLKSGQRMGDDLLELVVRF